MPGDDLPNADSLRWFSAEVLPLLRREFGEDCASRLSASVMRRRSALSIMRRWICSDRWRIFDGFSNTLEFMVAPTRFAAGIPHKVHQAAAFGVPVVTTSLIAAQANWRDGRDLLAASDARGFAEACTRLYRDEALWTAIRNSALERCATDCSPEAFRQSIGVILDMIVTRARAAKSS